MYVTMAHDLASAMHSERLAQAEEEMRRREAERRPAPWLRPAAGRARRARSPVARATRAATLAVRGLLAGLLALLLVAGTGGGASAATHYCWGHAVTNPNLIGGMGSTTIVGTPGNDVIWGGGGNDTIYGGGGDDIICGGDGNDTIFGGAGNDLIFGNGGNDTIYGGDGDDKLYGGDGYDRLYGESGNDLLVDDTDAGTYNFLNCGPGTDTASGDQIRVACELTYIPVDDAYEGR